MKYRGVIFDLDGTLVDNLAFHFASWVEMGKTLGVTMTKERMENEFSGRKNSEIFPRLLGREVPAEELARLSEEKERLYRDLYRPHLKALPGSIELIRSLRARGVKTAIGSAAPAKNRAFVLEGLGIVNLFDTIVGSEDVARGKPSPDLFLEAAKRLGLPPSECLVFEDAVLGVQAAVAAEMDAAAVTTTHTAAELVRAGAKWTSRDFTDLAPDLAARLARNEKPGGA